MRTNIFFPSNRVIKIESETGKKVDWTALNHISSTTQYSKFLQTQKRKEPDCEQQ